MNYSLDSLDYRVLFDPSVFNSSHVKVRHFVDERLCVVMIVSDDGQTANFGISIAHEGDDYNKKIARNIAYARAMIYPIEHNMNDYFDIRTSQNFISEEMTSELPFTRYFYKKNNIGFHDMRMDHICKRFKLTPYYIRYTNTYISDLYNDYFRYSTKKIQDIYMKLVNEPVEHLLEHK